MARRPKDFDYTRAWAHGVFITHCQCVHRRFVKGEKFPTHCPDPECGMRVAWQELDVYTPRKMRKEGGRRMILKGPHAKDEPDPGGET